MSDPSTQKSTIVRAIQEAGRLVRRGLSELVPARAGRRATELWFTVPPGRLPADLPAGGRRFTVATPGSHVVGHVWGEGPVVYLVHGWGGRGAQLSSYVQPLVAAGHRVVLFDGPAHGDSPAGSSGPGRTHGVELARALDEVATRFGPAHTVIAHSLGAVATYLALRHGWLGTGRLVLLAPMVESASLVDAFSAGLGLGRRARRAFERCIEETVGFPIAEFDARVQAVHADAVPTLVVADLGDRQAPYDQALRLVRSLPDARLLTTDALGHRRILADPKVVREVLAFMGAGRASARVVA